jgi:hypothetical protein
VPGGGIQGRVVDWGMVERTPAARFGLTAALGVNLWLLGLVVPLCFSRAGAGWIAALIPPGVLAAGVVRRSAPALLLGVPVATLAPLAMPELEGARQNGWGFALVLCSLTAYAIAALRALEGGGAPAAESVPLPGDVMPPPWPRRIRIYRVFTVTCAILPALLVYAIDVHPPHVAAIGAAFPGAVERAQAAMTALAGLLCAMVFAGLLVRPLAKHLDRDFAVRVRMEQNRAVARVGRPRAAFYLAVGVALALMAAVVLLRR